MFPANKQMQIDCAASLSSWFCAARKLLPRVAATPSSAGWVAAARNIPAPAPVSRT